MILLEQENFISLMKSLRLHIRAAKMILITVTGDLYKPITFFLHQLLKAIPVLKQGMKYLMLGKNPKLGVQRFMELPIMSDSFHIM